MFVEEVTVTNKQGDTVVFPCRCWLGRDDSDGTIIRELVPGKPVPEEVEGKCHVHNYFHRISNSFALFGSVRKFVLFQLSKWTRGGTVKCRLVKLGQNIECKV